MQGQTLTNLAEDINFQQQTRKDFSTFKKGLRLYMRQSSPLLNPLLCLSVAGHAQNGHGEYNGAKYPNVHVTDVMSVLTPDIISSPEEARRTVSKEIDRTKLFLERLVEEAYSENISPATTVRHPTNKNIFVENQDEHNPLFDLLEFSRENYNITNPKAFLKGATLAAFMDSSEYRGETLERFGGLNFDGKSMNIGYGKCLVGDRVKLDSLNLPVSLLSEGPLIPGVEEVVYEEGAILDINDYTYHDSLNYNENLINVYLREKKGLGTSDDAALIWIGKKVSEEEGLIAGRDAFLGAMLLDVVDTYDKMSAFPINGGADEYFGRMINKSVAEHTGNPLVSGDDITELIYFAAKNNTDPLNCSNSHRRFQQQQTTPRSQGRHQYTPIQAHSAFTFEGKRTPNLIYGFTSMDSTHLYNVVDNRLGRMEKLNLL